MQLHLRFIKTAKRLADKEALIDGLTERRMTYSKMLIASLILKKLISKYKDGFVGIMLPNGAGSFLSILGTLMSGKVPVMINYSTGANGNCQYAQAKLGFSTIITAKGLIEKIGCTVVPGMVFIEDLLLTIKKTDKLKAALFSTMPLSIILKNTHNGKMDDNAVILFTSGSEKDPKAVQLTHQNFVSNLEGILNALPMSQNDVMLSILPLFHVFGHNVNFWLPLVSGMRIVTWPNPIEYHRVVEIIKRERPTVMAATPSFFSGYLRQSQSGDLSSIRLAIPGADKTSDWLREAYWEKHRIELLEGYGTTETSPVISVNRPGRNKPGSIGLPLNNVQVHIESIDSDFPMIHGQPGKILVKGELVMKGYFDDIEETSYRIRDGWYDTGDMGYIDNDGFLWHLGRLRRFVKIGGEMVSLVKVESELESLLPQGVECCVVEIPDSLKGAKIVAVLNYSIDERRIIKSLSENLPHIAIPRQFLFMKDLPKMGSGKIDFRSITEYVRIKLSHQH